METIVTILNCLEQNEKIKNINGVIFTGREIDIVACLIHGRSIKKIALLLSISPKTVEVHIRNIMLKVECNSREKIIDFIESSKNHLMIREHYGLILERNYFNSALEKIKNLNNFGEKDIKIIYGDNLSKENVYLVKVIEETLNKINFKVHRGTLADQFSDDVIQIVYIVTNESEKEGLRVRLEKNNTIERGLILYLNMSSNVVLEQNNYRHMFLDNNSSFFLMIFEILSIMNPSKNICKIKESFLKQFNSLSNLKSSLLNENILQDELTTDLDPTSMSNDNSILFSHKSKYKNCIILLIPVFLVMIIFSGFYYNIMENELRYAQADLLIPSKGIFLKRDNLFKKIESVFNKNDDKIKYAIIVGMGGIGKTTIARNYAINQNSNIFWEINAENEMEIIKSFERLAVALSRDKEEKREIGYLYRVEDIELLKVKLMSFIQEYLYKNPGWLLIYDNVHHLNDIVQYIPHNENIWGAGKVLILTRNQNIADSKYVDGKNIIQMPELAVEERKKLFSNICYFDKKTLNLDSLDNDKLEQFLDKIPPFPLDVITAAYFLKNTKLGYDEYLKHINNYGLVFRDFDNSFLKDIDNNFKTRYSIVTNTIQSIINNKPDFKNKLFEISLLDPNDIPLELLSNGDENENVLSLIRELSRYSLVNYDDVVANHHISIHRSIHNIIYLNLKDYIYSKNGLERIKYLNKIIANELCVALNKEEINKIRSMTSQSGEFIKNTERHINAEVDQLKYQMGRAYRYLGRFKDSIAILESIKNFENDIDILLELGTTYKNIGKYDKSIFLIEKALNISKQKYGDDNIQTARVEIRLDTPYRKLKKYKKIKELLEHSLHVHKSYENIDLGDIAWIYTKLGHINVKLGYLEDAIELFKKSLNIQLKLYGKNNIRTAWTYVRMADAYKELNKNKIAQDMLINSLRIYEGHYGKIHTKTAWVLCSLGEVEGLLGHFKQAEEHIKEGLKIQKQYYGEGSIRLSWAFNKLGELYKRENMSSEANYYFNLKSKALHEIPLEKP